MSDQLNALFTIVILGLMLAHGLVAAITAVWLFVNRKYRSRILGLLFISVVFHVAFMVASSFSRMPTPWPNGVVFMLLSLVVLGVGMYPVSFWLMFGRRTLFDSIVMDLINSFPDAVVITDFSDDQKILFVNKKLESISGYDRVELIGQSVDILVPEASRPQHVSNRRSYRYDPITRPMGVGTFALRRKEGPPRSVQISLASREGSFIVAAIREVDQQQPHSSPNV